MSSSLSSSLSSSPEPKIALIIPSLDGRVDELRASIDRQNLSPHEVEVVVNVRPNGRARNVGVARSSGDILVFVDDDAVLGSDDMLEKLVAPLRDDASIGVTGTSKLLPPDASAWQRYVAREVPRIEHAVVTQPLETNPDPPSYYCEITTTCCAMRRAVFEQAGGFSETLVRGVDTEFFVRVRQRGYRFVLVPHAWVYHPAPPTLRALLRKHFLYGVGHAQEVRGDPSRARGRYLHTPLHAAAYLAFRSAVLVPNIFLPYSFAAPSWKPGFKPLKAITSYVGAVGYVWGWYTAQRAPHSGAVRCNDDE
jgi:cellulose synthase/poly-beta-1,6-N-acetylglucosamine synthase-like glycosyltransferase